MNLTNTLQAGYHILMVLAVIDGKYDHREGMVIANYIQRNYMYDMDIQTENNILLSVDKDELPVHVKTCCEYIAETARCDEMFDFVWSAYQLIHADNIITVEERKIFDSICKVLGMDSSIMLADVSELF